MEQLMNVDIRTLMFLLSLGNLSAAGLLLLYLGRLRDAPDSVFALAKLQQGLGWPLLALRGAVPDILSFGLGNALLLTGFWLEAACVRALDTPDRLWPPAWKAQLAALAACLVAGAALPQANLRLALISAAAACCFALTGLRLLRGQAQDSSLLRRILGAMYLLLCAATVWRGLVALAAQEMTLFSMGIPCLMVYPPLYLLLFGGNFGLLLVFKERDDQTLRQMAVHDELTGAPNRRALMTMAARLTAKAHREGTPLAVLMLDIDRFKLVNDRLGHVAGDAVLRELTRVIAASLRTYDIYGRYGGEEFVVLLPGLGLAEALSAAERIRAAAERSRPPQHEAAHYTVSIGVAWTVPQGPDLEPLLRASDMAMYRAKELGRNRVEVALPEDWPQTVEEDCP